jgi:tRNA A37 threonylcarbamoyladenosine dehydratase
MSENIWQQRTELQIGKENLYKLANSHVLVVGIGGVGAYAAEMLCRAGVGYMTLVDGDIVQETNLNRQLPSLNSTLGLKKVNVMAQRMKDINPEVNLNIIDTYIKDEQMIDLLDGPFDYVVDAIDTLSPKVYLIFHCMSKGLPIVSSMGAGGKFDPTQIKISDISESYNCKFARIIRKRLHAKGIFKGFKVVFSPEGVDPDMIELTDGELNKRSMVGTISYMPAAFGCACASVVLRDLIGEVI